MARRAGGCNAQREADIKVNLSRGEVNAVSILVAILCFALSACVASQPIPSAPLSKPTLYEWIGPGPHPSAPRLAQDKLVCVQDAHQKEPLSISDRWQAHLNLCMQKKGWGQKAVD